MIYSVFHNEVSKFEEFLQTDIDKKLYAVYEIGALYYVWLFDRGKPLLELWVTTFLPD